MMKKIPFIFLLIFVACNSTTAQQMRISNDGIKLERTLQLIRNLYVDEVDTHALTEAAIRAMLRELDPHSSYLDAEEVRVMNEPLQGNTSWYGIGVQFNMLTDTLSIIEVVSGGPAQQVGVLAGDRIISVNDTIISGVQMNQNEVVNRLRGPRGVPVNIKVLRRGMPELLNFTIVRDRIPIFSIDAAYMVADDIGYIRISRFAQTTTQEFKEAEQTLKAQGMKNLIVDLTGNGGGILQTAAEISSEFLGANKLVVYTEGRNQPRMTLNSTPGGEMLEGRVVVLVDEQSASASEILAGALQDWDRGIIVGRRTFGKGTVQRQIPLPDGTMIRLTVARYYTPVGRSIQKPYEEGNIVAYNQDIMNRFLHGEMFTADSIHFPDSLMFRTKINERIVFGGGGITPDYFVPMDTTSTSRLHQMLHFRGLIIRTAMSEADQNREQLTRQYPNAAAFQANYRIPQRVFDRLKALAAEDNIEWNEEQFEQAQQTISLQIRSLMARDLYDTSAFFQIINSENNIFQEGLRIISNPERYENLLRGIGSNVGLGNGRNVKKETDAPSDDIIRDIERQQQIYTLDER